MTVANGDYDAAADAGLRSYTMLTMITGASAGIGLACAERFAAEGHELVLWARRADRLGELATRLTLEHGVSVCTHAVDVRDRDAVQAAADAVLADVGIPNVLINNAGLASGFDKFHEGSADDWDRMIDTNLKGLMFVSRAILPAMVKRGHGHVINLGSTAGHQAYPKGNVYAATKFGVRALTKGMNIDLAGTAVKVSSVDPGYVETEFSIVRFHGDTDRADAVYSGFQPLSPEDVADTIWYVASRPAHINVFDVILVPTAQRDAFVVDRHAG